MERKLFLKVSDLPKEIVLTGDKGEQRIYTLRAAGRKFGALLCAVEQPSYLTLPNQEGHKPAA